MIGYILLCNMTPIFVYNEPDMVPEPTLFRVIDPGTLRGVYIHRVIPLHLPLPQSLEIGHMMHMTRNNCQHRFTRGFCKFNSITHPTRKVVG